MDLKTVDGAVSWLLDARSPGGAGWGKLRRSAASVTVSAEVIVALDTLLDKIPAVPRAAEVRASIDSGLDFVESRLAAHPDPDLSNFSYAAMAHIRARSSPSASFLVGTCLEGILGLRGPRGWKPRAAASEPTTFASCLAALALQDILRLPRAAQVMSDHDRTRADEAYQAALAHLFAPGVMNGRGGWRDSESPDTSSNPAITSLALYVRTRHLRPPASLGTVAEQDAVCTNAINYLATNVPTQTGSPASWTYRLRESDYEVFYLPYAVLALSKHRDWLAKTQLEFYWRAAHLLAGPEIRRHAGGELTAWFTIHGSQREEPVWATAHALRGLLSVPLSGRNLDTMNSLLEQRARPQTGQPVGETSSESRAISSADRLILNGPGLRLELSLLWPAVLSVGGIVLVLGAYRSGASSPSAQDRTLATALVFLLTLVASVAFSRLEGVRSRSPHPIVVSIWTAMVVAAGLTVAVYEILLAR